MHGGGDAICLINSSKYAKLLKTVEIFSIFLHVLQVPALVDAF